MPTDDPKAMSNEALADIIDSFCDSGDEALGYDQPCAPPELREAASRLRHSETWSHLPPGTYRVVDGVLHRVMDEHAPFTKTPPTPPTADEVRELVEQVRDRLGGRSNAVLDAKLIQRLASALEAAMRDGERLDWLDAAARRTDKEADDLVTVCADSDANLIEVSASYWKREPNAVAKFERHSGTTLRAAIDAAMGEEGK